MKKLNEMLGIADQVQQLQNKKNGKVIGVTEEEIQEFREIQGIIYFLQAPALFSFKTCGHCGEGYAVSRKFVAYCSYTCIKKSLEEQGITWRKGHDLEELANDPKVYDGNEPLWIRNHALQKLKNFLQTLEESEPTKSQPEKSGALNDSKMDPDTISSPHTTIPSGKTPSPPSSKTKKVKPKRTLKFK